MVIEQIQKALLDTINRIKESSKPSDVQGMDELSYVTMESKIHLRKGKWKRYSSEVEQRIIDNEKGIDADRFLSRL